MLTFMKNVKNKPENADILQSESMKAFTEYHKVLEKVGIEYKRMIELLPEEELRKFSKMGYHKELKWCLDIIESLKCLSRCSDREAKLIKQILDKQNRW